MSNATQDSRNSGGDSRRRRSRGGSNRNRNNNNENRGNSSGGGDRGSRDSRGNDRGNSQGRRHDSNRTEEFRPQAPRRTYAPAKLTLWQKILKMVGLYKEPAPPSRYDRTPAPAAAKAKTDDRPESIPFPSGERAPKSNTRNARSGEGDARPPREPREPRPPREPRAEGEARPPRKERAPRDNDRPRGGDPKSVESTRVYVGNLSYDVTEQDLQELFKGIGGVRNIEVVYNRSTHRSKGYGFVEMLRMDEAIRAVEVLHDQPFMGRKMTVSGAKSKGQDEREDSEPERGEPARVVLAPLPSAAAVVAAEPVIETIVEKVEEIAQPVAETATDLEAKYGFDEPKEKTEEA
ncbi:MAG: RNA-binding protein [Verrucomicrobiota bacterium]